MAKMDEAWNDVAEQFGALGALFEQQYKQAVDEGEGDPATQEQVDATMSKLKKSLENAVGAVDSAAKDPRLKEGARESAASTLDAIKVTFDEVGGEISKAVGDGGETA